ncbi:murein biosynthesis integral membrane protein MurJ [bacterium (Candidatus Gribaldobacteria) CG07_land_8_20_14_0_80_33_18]|uniref:Probable lipid II flippase MurJ n=1 Tax=bacterium (Candidatus Gribaldobacteria) CG07_land_8_20_14_0_80_33_18 TaxID=2014272 RepID=A0A2M6Z418_9BACT|nr:MAG: murein biosynthesis integral membrane protein MurJ [bacterium (Candidatus Gribaldobacteria) CG10_big_fil_rev_8_21_14_0_10_33_41]PIU47141.1 MAG: murein biosynthesis integral membrane protein MurJ [bacterium (Candidatus Gribaldobacteria) CG07_land_8_20_14_0_80_33_18]PJA00846.1 MAG: murein biosynthesis integral membrane protein MurJ [bacterium (Candidatus Gribaldobacteria) CG_4_10_14_0_2_um_filter_33_15]PJB08493.1 MAG: murein biosynthesis integral membrane protein MurJ [bacterium (Candidatu
MFNRVLNSKAKNITFAALILAVSALISQLLGFLRDNLLANLVPRVQTDIYFAAFRIPDLVYGILITGGVVAAFLPVFAQYFKQGQNEAKNLTNNVLTFFLIALVVICSFLAIFTPYLIKFIVPGFSGEQKNLTIVLTRIMFLSPILLGLSSIFSSILHYFNLFIAYSLAPLFYNLGIIFGILFFYPYFGLSGLAYGIILGALAHLLIQIPFAIKMGFRPTFSFNFKHPGLIKIFKLMLPRTVGSIATHLNLIVITAIASGLSLGSITIFNFSNNLASVPISLIGISFATAAFPALSRDFLEEKEKFFKKISSVFSQLLYLIIPLSVLIYLLRAQLVRIILGTAILKNGGFGWQETRLTAAAIGIFCFSLFASTFIPYLVRVFFSFQNTKTPVKIALLSILLNIILCYFFVWSLSFNNFFQKGLINFLKLKGISNISVLGLPLAFSISSIFQFFLLFFFLKRKISGLSYKDIHQTFLKILISTFIMAVIVFLTLQIYSLFGTTRTVIGIFFQTILAGLTGIFFYLFLSFILQCPEPKIIWSSILSQFKKPQ